MVFSADLGATGHVSVQFKVQTACGEPQTTCPGTGKPVDKVISVPEYTLG